MESNQDDWVHNGAGSDGCHEYPHTSKQPFLTF